MKKKRLKAKEVNRQLAEYNLNLNKKDQVELLDNKYIVINGEISFFDYENKKAPSLKYLQKHPVLKKITIDMGAVKFVVNGAEVMRPGITAIEKGINANELIMVVDEKNKVPLAVGIALFNSEDMLKAKSGKVIKNIHQVGDEIWNMKV